MTKPCPECGSTDVVADLLVFADEALGGLHPPYVQLLEPAPEKKPFVWIPKSVASGFRAAVCGACGYTRFYARQHAQLLEAQKKGYASRQFVLQNVLPM